MLLCVWTDAGKFARLHTKSPVSTSIHPFLAERRRKTCRFAYKRGESAPQRRVRRRRARRRARALSFSSPAPPSKRFLRTRCNLSPFFVNSVRILIHRIVSKKFCTKKQNRAKPVTVRRSHLCSEQRRGQHEVRSAACALVAPLVRRVVHVLRVLRAAVSLSIKRVRSPGLASTQLCSRRLLT